MYVILWELLCVLLEKRDIRVDVWRYRCESTWLFLFYYLLYQLPREYCYNKQARPFFVA